MNCEKFKSKLNTALDERQNPRTDLSLRAHALCCGECAELLDMHGEVLAAVREMPSVAPRADFAFRVLAAVEADTTVVRKAADSTSWLSKSKWLAGILTVAAALGFVVIAWNGAGPKPETAAPANQSAPSALAAWTVAPQLPVGHTAADLELHREWVTGLAQGIKPVTTSVYSALQTIWRTLPASELAHVIL